MSGAQTEKVANISDTDDCGRVQNDVIQYYYINVRMCTAGPFTTVLGDVKCIGRKTEIPLVKATPVSQLRWTVATDALKQSYLVMTSHDHVAAAARPMSTTSVCTDSS